MSVEKGRAAERKREIARMAATAASWVSSSGLAALPPVFIEPGRSGERAGRDARALD